MGRSPTSAVDRASHAFSQDVGRRVVTYSHAHTLVPTYECFNRCTYCNFRADPGRSPWVGPKIAVGAAVKAFVGGHQGVGVAVGHHPPSDILAESMAGPIHSAGW